MTRNSSKDIDVTNAEHREIGHGLLEEDMGPSSSMAHLYRGEIHRMELWRGRFDQTTYWVIVVMSAILTWTFASQTNPHYILLLGIASVTSFLVIEARRFQGPVGGHLERRRHHEECLVLQVVKIADDDFIELFSQWISTVDSDSYLADWPVS